jgi:hypothetical protein
MDFDPDVFLGWIRDLCPEYVWLGLNSKPESVLLSEPSPEKLQDFMAMLAQEGIEIRGKELRGLEIPPPSS